MGNYIPAKWYYPGLFWLPCFIAIVTAILHWGLVKRSGDSKKFIRYYMGSTGLKLFIYLTIIIVFAFINKPMVIPFALSFSFSISLLPYLKSLKLIRILGTGTPPLPPEMYRKQETSPIQTEGKVYCLY